VERDANLFYKLWACSRQLGSCTSDTLRPTEEFRNSRIAPSTNIDPFIGQSSIVCATHCSIAFYPTMQLPDF
jgi:hypothetical protein